MNDDPNTSDSSDHEPAEEKESDSSNNGMLYGIVAGMLVGALLMALTGNILWVALGLPFGIMGGVIYDSAMKDAARRDAPLEDPDDS